MKLENKIKYFEPEIARILAQLSYHVHPDIVYFIQDRNAEERSYFVSLFRDRVDLNCYLSEGSACVFPGVRRYVNSRGKKRAYSHNDRAILDDNAFPRHLWCFLLNGTAYSSPAWKKTGLNEFELAHVFSHKQSEVSLEFSFFEIFDPGLLPYGDFTCAANVILLPKGSVRPTDNSTVIKSVFYKRYIDLYGENTLIGRSGFKEENVPTWYSSLSWNDPILPPDWSEKVDRLMRYRKDTIARIMKRDIEPEAA